MARAERPRTFVLEDIFSGRLRGWGITRSRFGKLANTFTIDAEGRWDPARKMLSLAETYDFDDGHRDRLDWSITRLGGGAYSGTETRLAGTARGEQSENWYRWRYSRRVPSKGGGETKLAFDDCFWMLDGGAVMAQAAVRKLGFRIATITVFYRKL